MSGGFGTREPVPFVFSHEQIEGYRRNGIVVARLDRFIGDTDTACRIFTDSLLPYERPAYAWVKQTNTVPKVVIASERIEAGGVRKSALHLDAGRELSYIDLSWSTHHPRIIYFEPELTPKYME